MRRVFGIARAASRPWKLLVLVLAIAGSLAVAGIGYSIGGPNAQLTGQARVYGGGGTEPGCFVPDIQFCRTLETNFAIDAHAAGNGQAAYGDRVGAGSHAQVTCLAVDGHNAVVGGVVTSDPSRPSLVGDVFAEFYVDNGTLDVGGDLISPFYIFDPSTDALPPGFPYVCPSPDTGAPDFGMTRSFLPISRGDIVVGGRGSLAEVQAARLAGAADALPADVDAASLAAAVTALAHKEER